MQIKDEHQAGTLNIGDYVMISFIDGDPEKVCAILKAHKTWLNQCRVRYVELGLILSENVQELMFCPRFICEKPN